MINVIPLPNYIEELGGEVGFCRTTSLVGDFPNILKLAGSFLGGGEAVSNEICFTKKALDGGEEAYEIVCTGVNAQVFATSERGAFYALMTIVQLADGRNGFKGVLIKDSPVFSYRGFMLDSARHFWTVDKVKQILDVMACLKMNYFHWHLTDDQGWRVEILKYPLLTEKGSIRSSTPIALKGYLKKKEPRDMSEYGRGLFYTQNDLKDIVAYAKERFIEVIPEIDMPGHLVAAISCYPELSCLGERLEVSNRWGVLDDIGCCGKENIYSFVKDIIDELCEIFPCKYFHIGGDEVPKKKWEKCPVCQQKIKELGLKNENALQGYFNNEVAKYLKSKNKTMIGWNEILEAADTLDKDIVVQWWKVTPFSKSAVAKRLNEGGKVLLSLWGYVYMDHAYATRNLEKTYSLTLKNAGLKENANILGVEAPQWTEYVRNIEKLDFNTFARLIAIAEVGWTRENMRSYPCFEQRLENMRVFFEGIGAKLPSQRIYRGNAVKTIFGFKLNSWKKWVNNPNFEVEIDKKGK